LNVEILYLEQLQFSKVSYYTVQVKGRYLSEFRDFQTRMQQNEKDKKQLAEINRFIEKIGKHYGAEDRFFKREGNAERLPPATYRFIESDGETDFGLRLYCVKVSEEVVILLNGDRKTTQSIKDCPNCKPHFDFANKISDAIYEARTKEQIEIDGFEILMDEDFTLNI
jgi:hypothetical protein